MHWPSMQSFEWTLIKQDKCNGQDDHHMNELKWVKNFNGSRASQRSKDQCTKCKYESKNQLKQTPGLGLSSQSSESSTNQDLKPRSH